MNVRVIIRNFSYSASANVISFIITLLSILIIPKLIGVREYGYWQVYLFYTSYIGFFHFGHADGVYLKYGGMIYQDLDINNLGNQFSILIGFELIFSMSIMIYALIFLNDGDRSFIIALMGLSLLIVLPNTFLLAILQATNRINEYATSIIIERLLFGALGIGVIVLGAKSYKALIVADLFAKTISLVRSMQFCRGIIGKRLNLIKGIVEAFDNVKIGIKLMFSNIASRSIVGIVRFGIERAWDVMTFGKISLTLNISHILMLFINAIGIVLYPLLRNTPVEQLPKIYFKMRNILIISFLGMLITYYPINAMFSMWLPEYADNFVYMGMLFPICIYESKMSMLIAPCFNALRRERLIMQINLIVFCVAIMTTILIILIFKNIFFAVLSITILLALRSTISELALSRILIIDIKAEIILELLLSSIFILSTWWMSNLYGAILYMSIYLIYVYFKLADVLEIKKMVLSLINTTGE